MIHFVLVLVLQSFVLIIILHIGHWLVIIELVWHFCINFIVLSENPKDDMISCQCMWDLFQVLFLSIILLMYVINTRHVSMVRGRFLVYVAVDIFNMDHRYENVFLFQVWYQKFSRYTMSNTLKDILSYCIGVYYREKILRVNVMCGQIV